MKKLNFLTFVLIFPLFLYGQLDSITIKKTLKEVNVNAIKANKKTPVTFRWEFTTGKHIFMNM